MENQKWFIYKGMVPEFKKHIIFDLLTKISLLENNFFQTWMHLQFNELYNSICNQERA